MQIPSPLIHSLQGIKDFDEASFIAVHNAAERLTSVRINPLKISNHSQFLLQSGKEQLALPVPWCANGFYLKQRPSFTFDPLFHAGCYYVQEASSMFLEQAILQTVDLRQPLKILDLCAAPGGKSTHIQSLISKDSLLISNEVIRSRAAVLKDNIVKWGSSNVLVTNNDPKDFATLKNYFDLIVIDAPCSGSGLFRRDEEAIAEWGENNVLLCSQRQQRIIADVLSALKDDGILIYSTCSYSKQEDEEITDWICSDFEMENVKLNINPAWNITEVETADRNASYRFWPHLVKGEGFFLSVFKKKYKEGKNTLPKLKVKSITKKEQEIVAAWAAIDDQKLVSFGGKIYTWPAPLFNDFDFLAQSLRVIYSDTLLGELVRDKFIPEHALAMSQLASNNIQKINLDLDTAIAYLQRKDISTDGRQKGWQLASYKNYPLGWMNVLQNRINNYYPKELRILKERS